MIQQLFRRRRFRKLSKDLMDKKQKDVNFCIMYCATKIQSLFRMRKAMKTVKLLRAQRRIENNLFLLKCVVKV